MPFCNFASCVSFFFFQAEDGIRDHCVTGVQTCALPILALCGEQLYASALSSAGLPILASPASSGSGVAPAVSFCLQRPTSARFERENRAVLPLILGGTPYVRTFGSLRQFCKRRFHLDIAGKNKDQVGETIEVTHHLAILNDPIVQ